MPRRGEPSRQQQAFLSLLDQQCTASQAQPSDHRQHHPRASSTKHHRKCGERQQERTTSIPGFKLRVSDPPARGEQHAEQARHLQAIFDHVWDIETIQQVLAECKGSMEAATDFLLDMAGSEQIGAASSAAQPASSFSMSTPVGTHAGTHKHTS